MLQYTQFEVEDELKDCFPHGYIRDVAVISGLGESHLGRGINQNDDVASFAYQFLRVQCALDEKDPAMGDKHWNLVSKFRETSQKRRLSAAVDLRDAARIDHEESADVTDRVLADAPLDKLLEEVDEQIRAAVRFKATILEKITAERTLKAQIEQEDKPLVRRVMAEKVAEVHERRNGHSK